MTVAISSTLTAGDGGTPDPNYAFKVTRSDQGVAKVEFLKDGKAIYTGTYGGWDDGLPWAAGDNYTLRYGGKRFGEPFWKMAPDPTGREAIQLHLGNSQGPSQAVTGCISADGAFLEDVKAELESAGKLSNSIPLTVENDFSLGLAISTESSTVTEGGKVNFTVSLTGTDVGNGTSKDIWVRLNIPEGNAPPGEATYNSDYNITLASGSHGGIVHEPGKNTGTARWDKGWYVEIPAGQPSASYTINASDILQIKGEGTEDIDLTINDYFIVRHKPNGSIEKYSDTLTQPGVLLSGNAPTASVDILKTELPDDLSGGIEGVTRVYSVAKGQTIYYTFDAFSIPDDLIITDGTVTVGTGGFVSGVHSGSITSSADEIRVVVIGSDPDTAWTLHLEPGFVPFSAAKNASLGVSATSSEITSESEAFMLTSSLKAASFAMALSTASVATAADASLQLLKSNQVTVDTSTESVVQESLQGGKQYLIRIVSDQAATSNGVVDTYFKVIAPGATTPSVEVHDTVASPQPSVFITASTDETVNIAIGSDPAGNDGTVHVEIFDATSLHSSFFQLGDIKSYSFNEGDEAGRDVVPVYRFGDLSKAETITIDINPAASHGIDAADLADPSLHRTVTFAPGADVATIDLTPSEDTLLEGPETSSLTINQSSLSAEALGNMVLLGLQSSVDLTIFDPDVISRLSLPTISSGPASANDLDGKIVFTVTLSEPSTQPISLAYTTVDQSALAGTDYVAAAGTITFDPGETSKEIGIDLIKHTSLGTDLGFFLKLLSPAGAVLENNAVVLTYDGHIDFTASFAPTDISIDIHTVAENSAAGTVIGTLAATDPDSGDTATFSLDPSVTQFAINGDTLVVAPNAVLDFEDTTTIPVSVTATDSDGLSLTKTLTISLTDVAETFTGTSGAENIKGDAGNNVIDGKAGDDRVDGGKGNDILTGGDGADRFVASLGSDHITDFVGHKAATAPIHFLFLDVPVQRPQDHFDVSGLGLTFADFTANATQSGADTVWHMTPDMTVNFDHMLKADFVASDFFFI